MKYSNLFENLNWWQSLLAVIIAFAIAFGIFMLNAWVLSLCWNIVIPVLFSLSTITVKQAAYLILVVLTLRFGMNFKFKNDDNK